MKRTNEPNDRLRFEQQHREFLVQEANLQDVERLVRIFVRLGRQGRADMLEEATRNLLRLVIGQTRRTHYVSDEELNRETAERIAAACPCTGIDDLYALARSHEGDADESFFPDGRASVLLGPAAETYSWAESMAESYAAFSGDHRGLVPLDEHFESRDPDVVQAKAVGYFAELLFEWRDRFLRQLFADLARSEDSL